MSTHARMTGGHCASKAGLSVAEVLVVLVIASLVLSIILPVAARSVADNLRVGRRGLNAQELSIREDVFRRLVQSAIQPPAEPGFAPASDTIQGDGERLTLTALPPAPAGCAGEGRATEVNLVVVVNSPDTSLRCESGDRSVALLVLSEGSRIELAYSRDGQSWTDRWPPPARLGSQNIPIELLMNREYPVLSAPLIRVTAETPSGRLVWIERAGRPLPVEFRMSDAVLEMQGGARFNPAPP